MPSWLVEDLGLVAILLVVGALLLLVAWRRDPRNKYFLIGGGALAFLAVVAAILWFFVETDQRKIKRKVEEMAAGIPGNLERVFGHISPQFRYGQHDKRGLRQAAEDAIRQRNVTKVTVWDVRVESVDRAAGVANVVFNFKIEGNWGAGYQFFYCRATFRHDEDGEWRLQGFQVFSPTNINSPLAIPGL